MTRRATTRVDWRSRWHRLRPYLQPHRQALSIGVLLLLATQALDKTIPWLLQLAIDGLMDGHYAVVQGAAVAVILCAAVMAVARIGSRIRIFNVGRAIEHDLRADLLHRVHRLGPTFFAKHPTGDIMSRAVQDVTQVRLMVGFGLLNFVNALLAYGMALTLMLSISPSLTWYALAPYPLLILSARTFGRAVYRRSLEQQACLGQLASHVQDSLAGMRVVRAFGTEPAELARFDAANERTLRAHLALVVLRAWMGPVLIGISSIATLVVLWLGARMVLDGQLSVGEFVRFHAYVAQLVWPTMGLGYILTVLQRGAASLQRVDEILTATPDIEDPPTTDTPPLTGEVRVRDLRFAFPGQPPVLQGVSLHVPPCRTLAIVGRTGCGKSTLAALLPRLLPTPSGSVFLDGHDVSQLPLRFLRRSIGYAPQEAFLFSTTVARNIGFGLSAPDSPEAVQRIRKAAEAACILSEIEAMPAGFDTEVGERGVQLSGGQRQRIALARALAMEPAVLVLDDPVSAVDPQTETAILQGLAQAGHARTFILVTHRVSAASRADHIVVLDAGRVVEEGDHASLLRQGGLYARLTERQRIERELEAV